MRPPDRYLVLGPNQSKALDPCGAYIGPRSQAAAARSVDSALQSRQLREHFQGARQEDAGGDSQRSLRICRSFPSRQRVESVRCRLIGSADRHITITALSALAAAAVTVRITRAPSLRPLRHP